MAQNTPKHNSQYRRRKPSCTRSPRGPRLRPARRSAPREAEASPRPRLSAPARTAWSGTIRPAVVYTVVLEETVAHLSSAFPILVLYINLPSTPYKAFPTQQGGDQGPRCRIRCARCGAPRARLSSPAERASSSQCRAGTSARQAEIETRDVEPRLLSY